MADNSSQNIVTKKSTSSKKKDIQPTMDTTTVAAVAAVAAVATTATVDNTANNVDTAAIKKKSNETTDGYKKIQNIITTANSKFSEDIQIQVRADLQEFKNSMMSIVSSSSKSSNDNSGDGLSKIADMLSKIDEKLNNLIEQQNFHNMWIKCTLEGALHKNDVDLLDIKPIIKGEVKSVAAKKAPAKATTSTDEKLSAVKSTNFLKYQVLNNAEYILQKFKDNEEYMTNCICEHIKALPIASSFNKDNDIAEKVEFFINYVKNNETASTKLFTLLNKNNTVFKKSITGDFESWKSQNIVNVNKDFLDGGEDV
jgi:hypothetical protein